MKRAGRIVFAALALSILLCLSNIAPAFAFPPLCSTGSSSLPPCSTFTSFTGWTSGSPASGPIGIAASTQRLLVTPYGSPAPYTNSAQIWSIDSSGTMSSSPFALLPPAGKVEDYLAISPGLGGPGATGVVNPSTTPWPQDYVYVQQNGVIYQVDTAGNVKVFAALPFGSSPCSPTSCCQGKTGTSACTSPGLPSGGITFDHVGTFGYDLIVTAGTACSTATTPPSPYPPCTAASGYGDIYAINSVGAYSQIAQVSNLCTPSSGSAYTYYPVLEGPAVAPLSFTPYPGYIIVASEDSPCGPLNGYDGRVLAVSPPVPGPVVVSTIATVPAAESVQFIASTPCSFGSPGGYLFDSLYTDGQIIEFPASDFSASSGYRGTAFVSSESSGTNTTDKATNNIGVGDISVLTSNGTPNPAVTSFQTNVTTGIQEGFTVVDCQVPAIQPTNATTTVTTTISTTITTCPGVSCCPNYGSSCCNYNTCSCPANNCCSNSNCSVTCPGVNCCPSYGSSCTTNYVSCCPTDCGSTTCACPGYQCGSNNMAVDWGTLIVIFVVVILLLMIVLILVVLSRHKKTCRNCGLVIDRCPRCGTPL